MHITDSNFRAVSYGIISGCNTAASVTKSAKPRLTVGSVMRIIGMPRMAKGAIRVKRTTLVYIERDGKYLMLHRTRKQNDVNKDKWIGVGGKIEAGETPEECARREVCEETGLKLGRVDYRGIVFFKSNTDPSEEMHLFQSRDFTGAERDCDEGELEWIDKHELLKLPIWEGDKVFLRLLDTNEPFFRLELSYKDSALESARLNGVETQK